jgi:hypothetical protein
MAAVTEKDIYLIPPLEILLTTLTVINKINDLGANTKSYKPHRWRTVQKGTCRDQSP